MLCMTEYLSASPASWTADAIKEHCHGHTVCMPRASPPIPSQKGPPSFMTRTCTCTACSHFAKGILSHARRWCIKGQPLTCLIQASPSNLRSSCVAAGCGRIVQEEPAMCTLLNLDRHGNVHDSSWDELEAPASREVSCLTVAQCG